MAEADVKKRFLNERKLNVQSDVAKVKKEYVAIISYINGLLSQVVSMLFLCVWFSFFYRSFNVYIFSDCVRTKSDFSNGCKFSSTRFQFIESKFY